jgi:hypothetical protein
VLAVRSLAHSVDGCLNFCSLNLVHDFSVEVVLRVEKFIAVARVALRRNVAAAFENVNHILLGVLLLVLTVLLLGLVFALEDFAQVGFEFNLLADHVLQLALDQLCVLAMLVLNAVRILLQLLQFLVRGANV